MIFNVISFQCSYLGYKCKESTEHLFEDDKFPCYFEYVGSDEIILQKNTMTQGWIMMGVMIPCLMLGIGLILMVKFYGHKLGLQVKDNNAELSVNNVNQNHYGLAAMDNLKMH